MAHFLEMRRQTHALVRDEEGCVDAVNDAGVDTDFWPFNELFDQRSVMEIHGALQAGLGSLVETRLKRGFVLDQGDTDAAAHATRLDDKRVRQRSRKFDGCIQSQAMLAAWLQHTSFGQPGPAQRLVSAAPDPERSGRR